MFFGTGSPNFGSILKPKVELMVFLRMRSNKIMKNGKMPLKCSVKAQVPREYMFFWYGESEFAVHFETGSRMNGVFAHAQ